MTTQISKKRVRMHRPEGEWLMELLADVHQQIATQPSPQAIERIRQRVFSDIGVPARVAA
jgi:hypothetical protein